MRPESTSVTFRDDLAAQVQEYLAESAKKKFVGRRIAPVFNYPGMDGSFPIFRRDAYKKLTNDSRTADGGYRRIITEFGQGTFATSDRGLASAIDQRTRKRYSRLFDAEVATVKPLVHQVLMNHEYRVASLLSSASFTNTNVTTAWSTASSAVPLTDIRNGVIALCRRCGCIPMDISMIVPEDDFYEMLACTEISNKTLYTYPGIIPAELSEQQVANMLGIKEVIVCRSSYDSTEEGYAESDAVFFAAGVIYLTVLAKDGDDLATPSLARTIAYTGLADDLDSVEVDAVVDNLLILESYEDPEVRGRVLRVRAEYDQVLQVADDPDCLCYKLTNT
jgi:hypothetical protein